MSWLHVLLGDTHFQRGDLENALASAEEGLRLSQKNHERQYEAMAWLLLGRVLGRMETPQIPKAEESILHGMKILDELKVRPYYAQGCLFLRELHAHRGGKEKALENLKIAEIMFQDMGMDYWLGETRKVIAGL